MQLALAWMIIVNCFLAKRFKPNWDYRSLMNASLQLGNRQIQQQQKHHHMP